MNISYTKRGNYLLPDLILKEEKEYNIGRYGFLKLEYLKEHKKGLYSKLLMNGELNRYLYDVGKLIEEKVNELVNELAEKEKVNEILKGENQIVWIGMMNNIKNCAEEIVFKDYLYGDLI